MKTTRNITLAIFISILLFSCKEAVKNSNSPVVEITVNQPATKKKKDNTRKIAKVNIKATVNGEDFSLTTYNLLICLVKNLLPSGNKQLHYQYKRFTAPKSKANSPLILKVKTQPYP